jgi:hypothetical protein
VVGMAWAVGFVAVARSGRGRAAAARSRATGVAAALVAVAGLALLAIPRQHAELNFKADLIGGLAIAASAPPLLLAVARFWRRTRRPALRTTVQTLAGSLWSVASTAAAIVFLATFFSAYLWHVVAVERVLHTPSQPAGSLVVDQVSDADAATIAGRYSGFGGVAWTLRNPSERASTLRVATPAVASCADGMATPTLQRVNEGCPLGESLSPVNTVVLDSGSGTPGPCGTCRPAQWRRTPCSSSAGRSGCSTSGSVTGW